MQSSNQEATQRGWPLGVLQIVEIRRVQILRVVRRRDPIRRHAYSTLDILLKNRFKGWIQPGFELG